MAKHLFKKGHKKIGGRKKGVKNKATIIAEDFFAKIKNELNIELDKNKKAIIKGTIKALSKGNPALVKEFLDRVYGKVTEKVEIELPDIEL